ncbi:MarR family transcriptional regulator [Pandoraea sp.]|uniref:MarR family winged helix-turn-helix transcriptional regulator n=1 Tax=Pandoraea sp. TaxID=1883445 RepID=UPI00120E6A53|nr:MarR family transcriptional regulator [Pandoraea sp.]TAL53878.1 MAG: MarR family transcriptional regulator [Pandoraea sp.]TAM14345.1 MAG: MarR family transcriptional regulator [Pandoraea sp.]
MRKQVDKVNQMPDASPDEVFESIHTIMHLYRSRQYRALREGPHELTHMEDKVLGYFSRHPGATQSDLAAHSGRDKAQLTRLIRGLRDKGLLDAEVDENDRRSTRLHVSASGKAMHRAVHALGARLARRAMAGLSDAESRQLAALLARVQTTLEAEPE